MNSLNAEADEIKSIFISNGYDPESLRSRYANWQTGAVAVLQQALKESSGALCVQLQGILDFFNLDYDLCGEGMEEYWLAQFERKRVGLKKATRLISN